MIFKGTKDIRRHPKRTIDDRGKSSCVW